MTMGREEESALMTRIKIKSMPFPAKRAYYTIIIHLHNILILKKSFFDIFIL
jgi:hypothetical protein